MKRKLKNYFRKLKKQVLILPILLTFILHFSNFVTAQITWYQQTTGTSESFQDVFFVNHQLGWAVGSNGLLLHTTNSGIEWSNQNISGFTENFNEVFFFNSDRGVIIGDNGNAFVTLNGGGLWNSVGSTGIPLLESIYFVDLSVGWVCGSDGTNGLIYKSTNGGLVWDEVTTIPPTGPLLKLEFEGTQDGWAVGSTGVFRTSDATNWIPQAIPTTEVINSISMANASKGWVVGANGTILHTTNGGSTWAFQSAPTSEHLMDVEFFDINNGVAVGVNGTVLYTQNGGLSWIAATGFSNTLDFSSVEMVNSNTILVGGSNGKIFKSPDVKNDLEILYYLGFDTLCANIPSDVVVTIVNNGPGVIETANIVILKGSDIYINYIWNGLLANGQYADVNLGPIITDLAGTYTGIIYGDSVETNNISNHNIHIIAKQGSTSGTHNICPGDSVVIEAFGGSYYIWSNVGLDSANSKQTVAPTQSQDYQVLIQTEHCLAPHLVQVIIDPCTDPITAISPNGDGINDFLIIDGIEEAENTVKIYDRWGDLINTFTNYDNQTTVWEGTNSAGEILNSGTYYYSYESPTLSIKGSSWVQIVTNN